MKIFPTLLAALLIFSKSYGQEKLDILELIAERAELEATLRQHFIKLSEALIEEFNYKEEGKILKYFPSLGYNFITQSPHFSYNTGALYAAINDKHIKKAKIRSIKKAMQVSFQAELKKLYKHYANLEADIEYYNHALDLYQLSQEIFKIKQQQYQNLEIAPLEFLSSQIQMKSEEMKLRKKYSDILKLKNHLLELAQAGPQPILFE